MASHILITPSIARPWWPTHERFECDAAETVWTDCCCCKMPATETDSRYVSSWDPPLGGMGCYQEPPFPWERTPSGRKSRARWARPYFPTGAYYDGRVETRCADGFGCSSNPRKRRGKNLREMWRHGP